MEQPKDIFHKNVKAVIWSNTLLLSLFIYLLFLVLTYYLEGGFSSLVISKSLAGTSAILFGASFSLSGFCYYWDFLDKKISYRKYLGLAGFWYALAYSISLLMVDSQKYFYGFWDNFLSADIILGMSSMAIFTFLAIISNDKAMIKLGPKKWRKLMRLGYVAWALLVFRAWALEEDLWMAWMDSFSGFPPPRLLLSLFVIAVILFRLSIEISKYIKIKNKKYE